jgi:uncharacterized protein YjiS (DUF1127 family)
MKTVPLSTALECSARVAAQRVRRRTSRLSLREVLSRIFALLREWRRRSRSRVELATLDDRMLRDIGVTRVEIWREIDKPFWRQ